MRPCQYRWAALWAVVLFAEVALSGHSGPVGPRLANTREASIPYLQSPLGHRIADIVKKHVTLSEIQRSQEDLERRAHPSAFLRKQQRLEQEKQAALARQIQDTIIPPEVTADPCSGVCMQRFAWRTTPCQECIFRGKRARAYVLPSCPLGGVTIF